MSDAPGGMDEATLAGERCGYAVVDSDENAQPCDRPATGWRWYQDCGHEDMLDVACDWHANEGGRRIVAAEAEVRRLSAALAEQRVKVERVEALCDRAEEPHQCGEVCEAFGCDGGGEVLLTVASVRRALTAVPSGEPDTEENR